MSSNPRNNRQAKLLMMKQNVSIVKLQALWRGKLRRIRNKKNLEGKASDEDDNSEAPLDKEEQLLENQAEDIVNEVVVETIRRKPSVQNLNDRNSQQIHWPIPITENFREHNWPILDDPHINVENWVIANQQIFARSVTWNLCARKPPSIDQTMRNLLIPNK